MPNRREMLQLSGAAALGLLATGHGKASAGASLLKIKAAGYPYDRVQAIKDGKAGIDQAEVSFHDSNIYTLNDLALGAKKTFEVTELGFIPFVTKYINDGFRGSASFFL